MGVPGFDYSRGGLGYYDDLTTMGKVVDDYPPLGIPAASEPPDSYTDEPFTYFGMQPRAFASNYLLALAAAVSN